MKNSIWTIAVMLVTGCATSTQSFVDKSYEDGVLIRTVTGRSFTTAPPFRDARAGGAHSLDMEERLDGWTVVMKDEIVTEGGDITEIIR